ncbi:MAG: cache domain-containing protein, partial [Anaerolineales bacterium]
MATNQSSQSQPETKQFGGKLARNLLFVILTLTIIPTLLMGLVSHGRTRILLINQITEQLDEILSQEKLELDNWLQKKENDISKIGESQGFLSEIKALENYIPGSAIYTITHDDIIYNLSSNNFDEFIITDKNGIVLVATKEEWENLDLSNEDSIHMDVMGEGNSSFIVISPNLLYPQIIRENDTSIYNSNIILITSFQLIDQNGDLYGYILGVSDVLSLQRVLETNSGYLPESKVFLVSENGQVVGMTTLYGLVEINPSEDQRKFIQSGPQASEAASEIESYNGLEVFGIYDYYDKINTGILVETPQSKVYSQFNSIAAFSVLLIALTIIVIAILVYFGTKTFTRPILN